MVFNFVTESKGQEIPDLQVTLVHLPRAAVLGCDLLTFAILHNNVVLTATQFAGGRE